MTKSNLSVAAFLIVLLFFATCTYVIKETERAVKLRFGEVVEADVPPGIHLKWPYPIERIRKFDSRILTLDARPERFITLEKKSLIVDSYAKWRVMDVQKYYTATNGEEARTSALLTQRINDGLRNEVGTRDMHEVVSGQRDELMEGLRDKLNKLALGELGIEVVDIRVKKVDLPTETRQSVFERMNTERHRDAQELRSMGRLKAEAIRADADKQRTIILSEAYRDAEQMRGEGDARAAAIYAQAYNQNSEFYAFWRSLKAYEQSFASKSDVLLLKPDSDFFRYLNELKPD